MEAVIEFIFARPVNENYHEFGINTVDSLKWIQRDELRHFISNNISQDIISIAGIRELVEGFNSFIIDNENKEWYELEFDFNKHDITNRVSSKELNGKKLGAFDKVIKKFTNLSLNLDKTS